MTNDEEILATLKSLRALQEEAVANQKRALALQEEAVGNQKRAIETQDSMRRFAKRVAFVGLLLIVTIIVVAVVLQPALESN